MRRGHPHAVAARAPARAGRRGRRPADRRVRAMTMPDGIGAVDLMIGFPTSDFTRHYDNLRALAKDAESKEFEFPAQYLFADAADRYRGDVDPIEATLAEMDRFGVAAGMIGDPASPITQRAL